MANNGRGGNFTDDNINNGWDINPGGHGTQAAGIIGAGGNQVAGMAPNVSMISMRVYRQFPEQNNQIFLCFAGKERAIDYARIRGIPILYAGTQVVYPHSFHPNIIRAVNAYPGLFVQAAGNSGRDISTNRPLPERPNVIVVGASDRTDIRCSDSNFGSTGIHIFAPTNVYTTGLNGEYTLYVRTSASGPHVAGVAALVMSVNPDLSPEQVKDIILDSADRVPALANLSVSDGRLNAHRAVRLASGLPVFTDVPSTNWANNYVQRMADATLMRGTGTHIFSPRLTATRAQFATVLGRIEDRRIQSDESSDSDGLPNIEDISWRFDDMAKEHSQYRDFGFSIKYVAWASDPSREIIEGVGDNNFAPLDYITREQAAALLFRYQSYLLGEIEVSEDAIEHLSSFPDGDSISGWAVPGMAWAVEQEIMRGRRVEDGQPYRLDPRETIARAEIAAIFYRFMGANPLLDSILDDFAGATPDLSFSLPINNLTLPATTTGSGMQAEHSVTVTNRGLQPTGDLRVTLWGEDASSFAVNTTTIASIPTGETGSFTIRPNAGLAVRAHTATVTVHGVNIPAQSFEVSVAAYPEPRTVTFDSNGGTLLSAPERVVPDGMSFHDTRTTPATLEHPTPLVTSGNRRPALGTGNNAHPWFDAQTGGSRVNDTTPITSDRTVWARWEGDVIFHANGGEFDAVGAPTMTIPTGTEGTYTNAFRSVIAPTRHGHYFVGWFDTDGPIGGTQYTAETLFTGSSAAMLWARWEPADVTVTFHWNDGCGKEDGIFAAAMVSYGDTVLPVTDSPNRIGYLFTGWYADGADVPFDFTMPVTDDLHLYAQWGTRPLTFNGIPNGTPRFTDIHTHDDADGPPWYYDYVRFVYFRSIMRGVSSTSFAPDAMLDRAMVAAILHRLSGENLEDVEVRQIFDDVDTDRWFAPYITWAYDAGIVTGTSRRLFSPSASITREQFATMLYRYADYMGDTVAVPEGFRIEIPGADEVSDWAEDAMLWAYYNELIRGLPGPALKADYTTSRAQSAALLQRFMQEFVTTCDRL